MILIILMALITAAILAILLMPLMRGQSKNKQYGAGLMVVLPLMALGLYFLLGAPDTPSAAALFETEGRRAEQRTLVKDEMALMQQLAATPKDTALMLQLGTVRLKIGRIAEALTIFEHAHKVAPDNKAVRDKLGGTHYAVALLMMMQKNATPKEILEHFDQALAIAPPDAPYYEQLVKEQKKLATGLQN